MGWSGLEDLGTLTKKTVADATNFAAKDLSSHSYGARPEILELLKRGTDVKVEPEKRCGQIQVGMSLVGLVFHSDGQKA